MRKSLFGLIAICLHLAFATSALAQVCTRSKGTYETYGDIVVDKVSKLAWKRCSDGQTWNGSSCSGEFAGYSFGQALDVTAPSSDGYVWRMPKPEELATLVIENASCVPAIDQNVFPRTVPGRYWTSQPLPKNPDAAYCLSFGIGASAPQRDQCWVSNRLPVRLVSSLPARSVAAPPPIAAAFTIDEAGANLVVLGSNFSRTLADNVVNFRTAAGVKSVVPSSGTDVSLTVAIPDDATTGAITVTTRGVTGQPTPGTLRVINSRDGCAAAGFTPATIPESSWEYCIFPATFTDAPADALIVGAHPIKLPSTQPSYMLSTSPLAAATGAHLTLSGRIALRYGALAYGALVVLSNAGLNADTLTTTGVVTNSGVVDNRGNFISEGSFINTGNGVVLNSGVFTSNPSAENAFSIATTGRAINRVSFVNSSAPGWPRAQLRNMGTFATESGSTGIENGRGDVVNGGTLLLEGSLAFVNRSGVAPGVVTNNGSIVLRIGTQPEGVPILMNEPGATIVNGATGSIVNPRTSWTFLNNGAVQSCGKINGPPPGPNGYVACVTGGIRRR